MFVAGAVSASLRGDFNPVGFMAFDKAMHSAKRNMDDVEKRGHAMRNSLAAVGKIGAGAAAAGILSFGAILVKSGKLAAEFEAELSRLKATTNANAGAMRMLRKDAMAAGAATKFSALEAAQAQVELAKGGLSVAQIHGGALKAALALAAAGELGLADAAATTVNAMKQFGLEGKQAGHVADALATAANSTTVDVSDLALALRAGGGVAAMAGASFDETVAAISALADASVRGSDAGTSLKSFFLNIATPSPKASKAMRDLGMSIFTAKGELKPLAGIADNLRSSFGKLTQQQFLNKAGTIAGSDAARALFAIYKAGPEGINKYLEAQQEVGSAAETAATKQDNLKGKIENLKGSLETAGIALGTGLLPGITDGAEKATVAINELAASGDLDRLGQDIGKVISGLAENLPQIIAAFESLGGVISSAFKVGKAAMATFYEAAVHVIDIVTALGTVYNALPHLGPDIPLDGLKRFRTELNTTIDVLHGVQFGEKKVKITADAAAATKALATIKGTKLQAKVMDILARDGDAKTKLQALIALGIPAKVARVLANTSQAKGAISQIVSMMNSIQSKEVQVQIRRTTVDTGDILKSAKKKASGRGAGSTERALVAEGAAPELVAGPDGWMWVAQPTIMDLGASDWVIPSDPAYSGRALGLMFGMLGVPGYAKGKAPAKKQPAPMPIPAAIRFGAVPEDELTGRRDDARESYQKRKERVRDLDVDIRAQRRKVASAKGKQAKAKEQARLNDLQRDRHRYNDGGDGLASLVTMRKRWRDLEAQAKELHKTNLEIERLNTLQETDRTRMQTAAKRGDRPAWLNARKGRADILERLRRIYAQAVSLAKPGSNFQAELEGKLAGVESDIAEAAGETFAGPEETPAQQATREAMERLADTGMTDSERQALAGLEAQQSLAGLTADLGDDKSSAVAIEGFLTNILSAVQADPNRGGSASVRDIADRLKQARDNVASFSGTGAQNESADLQAQIEQQRMRADVAERAAEINAGALRVFQGSADIGFGRPNFVINTLHPGDPATLRAIGDAATGGLSLQPSVLSPRQPTGL